MLNFTKSIRFDGDTVIIKRKGGYTKMPYERYLMLLRTGKLK